MSKLTKKEKVTAGIFFIVTLLLVIGNYAWSSERHHYHSTEVIQTTITTESKGLALAIASGQHHYKATTLLQWSVGAGYVDDNSAVSFGLGKQAGKVFVSGNFTSDGDTSAVGIGASGTF